MGMKEQAEVKWRSLLRRNTYYEARLQSVRSQGAWLRTCGDLYTQEVLEQREVWRSAQSALEVRRRQEAVLRRLSRTPPGVWDNLADVSDLWRLEQMPRRTWSAEFGVGWKEPLAPDGYQYFAELERARAIEGRLEHELELRLGLDPYGPSDADWM